jgi:hypothetical protein
MKPTTSLEIRVAETWSVRKTLSPRLNDMRLSRQEQQILLAGRADYHYQAIDEFHASAVLEVSVRRGSQIHPSAC